MTETEQSIAADPSRMRAMPIHLLHTCANNTCVCMSPHSSSEFNAAQQDSQCRCAYARFELVLTRILGNVKGFMPKGISML